MSHRQQTLKTVGVQGGRELLVLITLVLLLNIPFFPTWGPYILLLLVLLVITVKISRYILDLLGPDIVSRNIVITACGY